MQDKQLMALFEKAGKRAIMVGSSEAGVIIGLDLEGRWFGVLNSQVVSTVNKEAILGQCTADIFLNPGGDGLWPAPEGTVVGYEYATGSWRVPPGLRSARFLTSRTTKRGVTVAAEVDLINNMGLGIPTVFSRKFTVLPGKNAVTIKVLEAITYKGVRPLKRSECLLAPWSLCQFDSGPGCEVVFPCERKSAIWDLYDESSKGQQSWEKGLCRTKTDGALRYQIAIGPEVPWIEYRNPEMGLTARRKAEPLPAGQTFIDIRDAAPDVMPGRKGVRYSVYSDPACFMEIEAAGGCPRIIKPGDTMSVEVTTRIKLEG